IGKLEFAIRADLERRAPKAMAVLNPLRLKITSWPANRIEELEIPWFPGEPDRLGSRKVPFGADLLIEREDFSEQPPKGWKRLSPGGSVRLFGGYAIKCDQVVRSPSGEIAELRCSYDPQSKGGALSEGWKTSAALHWVHADQSTPVEARLYDRLFTVE